MEEAPVEPLIAALKHDDSRVLGAAANALGQIKDARAVDPLLAVLKDEDWGVRLAASLALANLKDARAVDPLIAALKDEDWSVQMGAAEALGEIKDARAVDPLIAVLKDKNENAYVRMAAAGGLGEINSRSAAGVLTTALKDKNLEVVASAHRFFIRRGEEGTEDVLIAALKEHGDMFTAYGFLICGNPKLEAAAVRWAEKSGFPISTLRDVYGSADLRWGSGR